MKSSEEQLRSRGYVLDEKLNSNMYVSCEQLLNFLNSNIPQHRTIAARHLKKFSESYILHELINRLVIEKKLYVKIALSESISEYGEEAAKILVESLGKIGKNQYNELPDKPFGKANYPLPRDIIARTICKIGIPALKYLKECLVRGTNYQILEAIDAIGFISYYENDHSCVNAILSMFEKTKGDSVMEWKLLRALQAFPTIESKRQLRKYENSEIIQLKWEAIRSLNQIERINSNQN